MKPFDLEKAKDGAKLCTRDGRPARLLCSDLKSEELPLVAAVVGSDDEEYVNTYTDCGCYYIGNNGKSNDDLFLAPTKHEGWVNVYKGAISFFVGETIYRSEEECVNNCNPSYPRVACVHIEWEE